MLFESTGNYEYELILALGKAEIPFHRANPRCVRDYAKSRNLLAKTDRIDAKILAEFAAERKPNPQKLPTQNELQFNELVRVQRQLTCDAARLKTQVQQAKSPSTSMAFEQVLTSLSTQIQRLQEEIDMLIQNDPDFRRKNEILQSVPGVGPKTSAMLLTNLRELGTLTSGEAVSIVGLAPFNSDSGNCRKKRRIRGGRACVRTALYLATLSAVRGCNPVLSEMFKRLLTASKPFKVAMIACARKLLIILNSLIRSKRKWENRLQNTEKSNPISTGSP